MRKTVNKGCVIAFAAMVLGALALAPRPSYGTFSASDNNSSAVNTGPNGMTAAEEKAYQDGYNKAYNAAYAQQQQAMDNQQQGGGGCCG